MLTVIGLMRNRHRTFHPADGYRTFGYPLTPLLFILGNLWIIFFSIKSRPITALFGTGTVGLGVLAYLHFNRRKRSRNRSVPVEDPVNAEN
jgi:APA family basic amino acid/polyamine antiporter